MDIRRTSKSCAFQETLQEVHANRRNSGLVKALGLTMSPNRISIFSTRSRLRVNEVIAILLNG